MGWQFGIPEYLEHVQSQRPLQIDHLARTNLGLEPAVRLALSYLHITKPVHQVQNFHIYMYSQLRYLHRSCQNPFQWRQLRGWHPTT